jgi:hypothetical protein
MAASKLTYTNGASPGAPASGKTRTFADSNGILNIINFITGIAIPLVGGGVAYVATPGDPTGTTDTTGKMAGLAGTFTPARSGNVLIAAFGNMTNSTASAGNGAKAQLRYGTGSAPANAAALTGTTAGNMVTGTLMRAASDLVPFAIASIVTGLTLGTAYWLDLAEVALAGGTGQLKNLTLIAFELP